VPSPHARAETATPSSSSAQADGIHWDKPNTRVEVVLETRQDGRVVLGPRRRVVGAVGVRLVRSIGSQVASRLGR
jgi:hypothetical protein